jgi:hypothetical protein
MLKGEVPLPPAEQGKDELHNRERLEQFVAHFRRAVAQRTGDVQRLTAEEAMLANEVAGEQSRWTEFNQRLEELERSLGGR